MKHQMQYPTGMKYRYRRDHSNAQPKDHFRYEQFCLFSFQKLFSSEFRCFAFYSNRFAI